MEYLYNAYEAYAQYKAFIAMAYALAKDIDSEDPTVFCYGGPP